MNYFILAFSLFILIAILILGKHGFDKTDELKGYFLAGRNLSLFPSIASFCATWFSAASLLGLPGLIYEGGVSVIWTTALAWLLGIVGLLFISSKFYTYNVVTVPEFFMVRYDSKLLQIWIGLILSISYLLICCYPNSRFWDRRQSNAGYPIYGQCVSDLYICSLYNLWRAPFSRSYRYFALLFNRLRYNSWSGLYRE